MMIDLRRTALTHGFQVRTTQPCCCNGITGFSRRHFLLVGAGLLGAGILGTAVAAVPGTGWAAEGPPSLDGWLRNNPSVADAIVFVFAGRGAVTYSAWTGAEKAALQTAYIAAWNGTGSAPSEPPANVAMLSDTDSSFDNSYLGAHDAFALFCALSGNSLAVEVSRRVPWSTLSDSGDALAQLFDARRLFDLEAGAPGAPRYRLILHGIPAPPSLSLAFLARERLIGTDRRSTIVNLLGWCRDQLWHFTGPWTAKNFDDHWHYRGFPPAVRVIDGTTYAGKEVPPGFDRPRHFTAGCWGTTAFISGVLRAVNIPVSEMKIEEFKPASKGVEQHSAPFFVTEGVGLSHGDDPYSAFIRVRPSPPVHDLLVSEGQLNQWFPSGRTPTTGAPLNVGRQVAVVTVAQLPIYLLNVYAGDVAARRPKEKSKVFEELSPFFSLAELESKQLWQRLDARITEVGGPEKVAAIFDANEKAYEERSVAKSPA